MGYTIAFYRLCRFTGTCIPINHTHRLLPLYTLHTYRTKSDLTFTHFHIIFPCTIISVYFQFQERPPHVHMAVSFRTHHACCRRFGSFHIGDILSICALLYQYVSFSKNSLSVLFPFLCRSDIGKDTIFFVTFQIYELLFLLFAAFFFFPSRTLFIIVRVLVGFPIFAPLHPLHLCTLCSIFAASPNGGSAGSAAQRGAGSASR